MLVYSKVCGKNQMWKEKKKESNVIIYFKTLWKM